MPRYTHLVIVKNSPKDQVCGVFVSPAFEAMDDHDAENKSIEMNVALIETRLFKYFESQVFKEVVKEEGENEIKPASLLSAFFNLKDGYQYVPVDSCQYVQITGLVFPD